MKKANIARMTLCLGTAALLIGAVNIPGSRSATLASETGLAGISLTLDKYYSAAIGDIVNTGASRAAVDPAAIPAAADIPSAADELTPPAADPSASPEATATPEPTPTPVSEYANVGISVADNYVYVRSEPDAESEALGKLYRGSAATILETVDDWVRIKSGNVTGYIKSEFLAIGFDAEELVDKYGTKWAESTGVTVRLREEPNTDCKVIDLLELGERHLIQEDFEGWVKVLVDEGDEENNATVGYISKDYVKIVVEFEHAVSIEEELAEQRRIEEARQAEEDQQKKLEEERRQQNQPQPTRKPSSSTPASKPEPSKPEANKPLQSGSGANIAAYARKFEGNPYVYGGTSLTNGADCSGFVYRIYQNFGITIPRDSRSQAAGAGQKVSLSSLQPGDLIFYTKYGKVNHVALYIGGGQVIHASTRKTGIKISSYNYRQPYCARRIVG